MSITPLSAARIVGEVGLAGGTATGGAVAAHYGKQLGESGKKIDNYETARRGFNGNVQTVIKKISEAKIKIEDLQDCMDVSLTPNRTWEACISKGELAKQAMVELQSSTQGIANYE